MYKLRITNKKPLLINTNYKNYPLVNKIYEYRLYFQNNNISFYSKKSLKNFLLEQYNIGELYADIDTIPIDCIVSRAWISTPIKSYVYNHFDIKYY